MEVTNIEVAFQYGVGDDALEREIARNVQTILSTPLGTCPLYRDFGINVVMVDQPIDVAQNLYAVTVMEAVERWEPRVQVERVTFSGSQDGNLTAKVVLNYVVQRNS